MAFIVAGQLLAGMIVDRLGLLPGDWKAASTAAGLPLNVPYCA